MTKHVKDPPERIRSIRFVPAGADPDAEPPDLIEVIDEILADPRARRWPAGTTDRLLADDRARPC